MQFAFSKAKRHFPAPAEIVAGTGRIPPLLGRFDSQRASMHAHLKPNAHIKDADQHSALLWQSKQWLNQLL
jgi:hypothetical protein